MRLGHRQMPALVGDSAGASRNVTCYMPILGCKAQIAGVVQQAIEVERLAHGHGATKRVIDSLWQAGLLHSVIEHQTAECFRRVRTSRLSCQIWLDAALDTLTVRIPGDVRNMQGR